jgi:16S rRNA (guanine1516-N2)-methyltransferase
MVANESIMSGDDFSELPTLPHSMQWQRIEDKLALTHRQKRLKPLTIDFIDTWNRLRIGQKDPFAKAIGFARGYRHVIDATVGLGGDLIKLLKLGCSVQGYEQSAVVFALLKDAQKRAECHSWWNQEVAPRLHIEFGKAEDHWQRPSDDAKREVIYIDPMFPIEGKSGASSRQMQYLQELLGTDQNSIDSLFQAALKKAAQRLVIKRPQYSRQGFMPQPDLVIKGSSVRYEIWLGSSQSLT